MSDSALLAASTLVPRSGYVDCLGAKGSHRMHYVEWGDSDNPDVVLCVHGLTRNARDFDPLARALAADWRVVCPDVVGRGFSEWLEDKAGYGFPQYIADMTALMVQLGIVSPAWVGTSMGGLIGMNFAATPQAGLRALVLNDIGPEISATALRRLGMRIARPEAFCSIDEVEVWLRKVCAANGALTDEQWRHLAEHAVRRDGERYTLHYDPAILELFAVLSPDDDTPVLLWEVYEAIRCPTLAIRGEASDILAPETLKRMAECGPHARTVEIAGAGHAPALMDAFQITLVRDFLNAA